MAILTTGNSFSTGNQVTASALNAAVNSATFASGAVDESTTTLSGGAIIVKDAGITMPKLASASNGEIPIGNGSGFTKATLTAGTNIGVTNASGSVTIAFSGTLPVANGGTGQTSISGVRSALGIAVPVTNSAQLDRTDSTYTDIPGLSVTLTSGTTYTIDYFAPWTSSSDSTGYRFAGTATASSVSGVSYKTTGSTLAVGLLSSISSTVTLGGGVVSTGSFYGSLTVVCNATGTFKIQFA